MDAGQPHAGTSVGEQRTQLRFEIGQTLDVWPSGQKCIDAFDAVAQRLDCHFAVRFLGQHHPAVFAVSLQALKKFIAPCQFVRQEINLRTDQFDFVCIGGHFNQALADVAATDASLDAGCNQPQRSADQWCVAPTDNQVSLMRETGELLPGDVQHPASWSLWPRLDMRHDATSQIQVARRAAPANRQRQLDRLGLLDQICK